MKLNRIYPTQTNSWLSWLANPNGAAPAITHRRRDPFDLDTPLCYFSENLKDVFSIRHAVESIQVFGSSGSGKSSGSGRHLALALLRSGAGGVVLSVKGDEPKVWREYCAKANRLNDLVIFSPGQPWRFNPLEYQFRHSPAGGATENIVNLLSSLADVLDRASGATTPDYFSRAMNQLCRNAVDLATIARGIPSLALISDIIATAPQSTDEARADSWQRTSLCFRLLADGERRPKTPIQRADWPRVVRFFLHEFPSLSSRTRSCVVSTFTTLADAFLRGEMGQLFGTTTNIDPEATFQGKILLLALPIKVYGEFGRLAQVLWKHVWQKSAEARDITVNPRHVFLWADEAQHFISRTDPLFLTTSRSAKTITVLLTQNIPNYLSVLSRAEVDSLLGNLATKIWHRNSCSVTNTAAADTIARSRQFRWSTNVSMDDHVVPENGRHGSIGGSDSIDWDILPGDFQYFRSGGPQHDFQVEGCVYQAGRLWGATGKNYLKVTFDQKTV